MNEFFSVFKDNNVTYQQANGRIPLATPQATPKQDALQNYARSLELASNKSENLVTNVSTKLVHQIPVLTLNPMHFN